MGGNSSKPNNSQSSSSQFPIVAKNKNSQDDKKDHKSTDLVVSKSSLNNSGSQTSSSSASSHSETPLKEVMLTSLVNYIPSGVTDIIYDYSFDAGDTDDAKNSVWLNKQPVTSYTFFGISSLRKQILALAEYAGPLDQIEGYIKKAHARKESHLQTTLMQAINFAVIGLDQTIRDEKGAELDKGMAERLLELHAELFPKDQPKALEQAKLAAPLEDEKDKIVREKNNVDAMNELFGAFIQNDQVAFPEAINTFNTFVKSSKPKNITDNRYYLNLMHLVFAAFDVLGRGGGQLPRIGRETYGQWYGKLADRFCFEIIGAAIESDMPQRVKQILRSGVYYLLSGDKKAGRLLDISGRLFRGDGTDFVLGVNSYFDETGGVRGWAWGDCGAARQAAGARLFSKLITSNYISIQNLLYSDHKLKQRAGV